MVRKDTIEESIVSESSDEPNRAGYGLANSARPAAFRVEADEHGITPIRTTTRSALSGDPQVKLAEGRGTFHALQIG